MRIASRIRALFLPLLVAPLAFVGFTSWFAAQDGITAVARDFQTFKLGELVRFASSQYSLLEANQLAEDAGFREVATEAIATYAERLAEGETENVFAVDDGGTLVFSTRPIAAAEAARFAASPPASGWARFTLSGERLVGAVARFEPFGWVCVVSQAESAFFAPVERITRQSLIAGVVMIIVVLVVVGVVARLITIPLRESVTAMRGVIANGDFQARVRARMNDETGELADSFNYMIESLDAAYSDIKRFALNAAYSERRESKIRTVFQRYVPQHVIDQFFERPESRLEGHERPLTVLYSDIRGFTTFSEGLPSGQVVESLNRYFGLMVDVVEQNRGIVDKYIGDAIMAFFGAPAENEHNARDAVVASFEMLEALEQFNEWQAEHGLDPFRIGIALNYGPVTVGNIGSERKMDYTVIGDMVNVASRLEGLTKVYRQRLLITESVRKYIRGLYPVRMVDRVQVKGRVRGLAIWTAVPSVTEAEEQAWKHYHAALLHYYNREFDAALGLLRSAQEQLGDDYLCELFIERASRYQKDQPDVRWHGLDNMTEK